MLTAKMMSYMLIYGFKTIILRRKIPVIASVILTDLCNLHCKHCSVNNIERRIYSYDSVISDIKTMYDKGARILMLYGGETMLWHDGDKTVSDIIRAARRMGYFNCNIVTNGTISIDVPEADTILVSLDGGRERHDLIRGRTYDTILKNIRSCNTKNICLYMDINKLNKDDIFKVGNLAYHEKNIKAVSFNFHTPYPDTKGLALTKKEKYECCKRIERMMAVGIPVFNLKSTFPYMINNSFPRPTYQCEVIQEGKTWVCGRCIDIKGMCDNCGFMFVCEYSLAFSGNIRVLLDMLFTYIKYI